MLLLFDSKNGLPVLFKLGKILGFDYHNDVSYLLVSELGTAQVFVVYTHELYVLYSQLVSDFIKSHYNYFFPS